MGSTTQAHATPAPCPGSEALRVCLTGPQLWAPVVRQGRGLADQLKAPWTAVYVESARHHRLSEVERDRIADTLRLAEQLGAETITIPGADIAKDVLAYAQANNVTQIVIGKAMRSRWFELLHGSVSW